MGKPSTVLDALEPSPKSGTVDVEADVADVVVAASREDVEASIVGIVLVATPSVDVAV